jgi:hypothetical protein
MEQIVLHEWTPRTIGKPFCGVSSPDRPLPPSKRSAVDPEGAVGWFTAQQEPYVIEEARAQVVNGIGKRYAWWAPQPRP